MSKKAHVEEAPSEEEARLKREIAAKDAEVFTLGFFRRLFECPTWTYGQSLADAPIVLPSGVGETHWKVAKGAARPDILARMGQPGPFKVQNARDSDFVCRLLKNASFEMRNGLGRRATDRFNSEQMARFASTLGTIVDVLPAAVPRWCDVRDDSIMDALHELKGELEGYISDLSMFAMHDLGTAVSQFDFWFSPRKTLLREADYVTRAFWIHAILKENQAEKQEKFKALHAWVQNFDAVREDEKEAEKYKAQFTYPGIEFV
jgi:hypothetical protein